MEAIPERYCISRIDQPDKGNHCWFVRIHSQSKVRRKSFPDKEWGSRSAALKAAQEYRDTILERIGRTEPVRRRAEVPQSGMVGVVHRDVRCGPYWVVTLHDGSRQFFSIPKLGEWEALRQAKAAKRVDNRQAAQQQAA